MSSENEKVTFGVTIEPVDGDLPAPPNRQHLSTIIERDSQTSNTLLPSPVASSRPSTAGTNSSPLSPPEYNPANPFSAFYEHPPARRSAELTRPSLTVTRDLEAQNGLPTISQQSSRAPVTGGGKTSVEVTKECTMWPSQKTLLAQRKEQKKKDRKCKACNVWGRMNKKQRIVFQILLALLIVGAAVGIGVGISKATGVGVWAGNGQTKQLPQSD